MIDYISNHIFSKDFTLRVYSNYISAIKSSYKTILRFDEFFILNEKPDEFCLIRHDIDRKPDNALKMARLEYNAGIRATYYFRTKQHLFFPDLIRQIADFGHEIGYHYESLTDSGGDFSSAFVDFEKNLEMLRNIVPIRTISMHGCPLSPFDNRDLFLKPENRSLLKHQYHILGELYLDIDYSNIAYLSDTGRNWYQTKSNLRDITNSKILLNFATGRKLSDYLGNKPHPQLVFQVHPERWTDSWTEYLLQYLRDVAINLCKKIIILGSSG